MTQFIRPHIFQRFVDISFSSRSRFTAGAWCKIQIRGCSSFRSLRCEYSLHARYRVSILNRASFRYFRESKRSILFTDRERICVHAHSSRVLSYVRPSRAWSCLRKAEAIEVRRLSPVVRELYRSCDFEVLGVCVRELEVSHLFLLLSGFFCRNTIVDCE